VLNPCSGSGLFAGTDISINMVYAEVLAVKYPTLNNKSQFKKLLTNLSENLKTLSCWNARVIADSHQATAWVLQTKADTGLTISHSKTQSLVEALRMMLCVSISSHL